MLLPACHATGIGPYMGPARAQRNHAECRATDFNLILYTNARPMTAPVNNKIKVQGSGISVVLLSLVIVQNTDSLGVRSKPGQ
jgi:hypothetical protein